MTFIGNVESAKALLRRNLNSSCRVFANARLWESLRSGSQEAVTRDRRLRAIIAL